jgi:hypothetical protein
MSRARVSILVSAHSSRCIAAPFFAPPTALVPASVVQGTGAHGADLLVGDLYVITGLAVLCLVGVRLIRTTTFR